MKELLTQEDWQAYLNSEKPKLAAVKDPRSVSGDDMEIHTQLRGLAQNLDVYARLKYNASVRRALLEKDLAEKTLVKLNELTEEKLEAVAISKQSKFKYVDLLMASEIQQIDDTKSIYKYFDDMWSVTNEWIMIYKKQLSSI